MENKITNIRKLVTIFTFRFYLIFFIHGNTQTIIELLTMSYRLLTFEQKFACQVIFSFIFLCCRNGVKLLDLNLNANEIK